ncbi:protein kinase domain-containing protein [Cryobacterium zhongshanensis]|uniref:non-specific serine/threonine protein kinase n=1 Tax=Cryobacterium zhongshanensis TaxID=2928153 RepID=A0AA41UFJ6_9MICO|nr:protein kinase [Cryobacterium zhongshanensis]MCI4658192.1 protein kinase [Cryobacterium zhongshanensis]
MSPSRAPSVPPELAGFRFEQLLGSGGFADVFLYEQAMPRRRVAVKVLLPDQLRPGSIDEFTAEANVMAMLSTHPSIVTIYQAGVSDDGRPYLVMEYCPKPNLQVRYRRERFGVGEALRIGIQVAGAVETSHRAGILHRDIKPANILVTEYNRPALTDFGISAATTGDDAPVGMSIPWSPPESFASPARSGPQSDVYALAATLYTLLAGRSPFQFPGGSNTSADVISRISGHTLPALDRPDVPASLEVALAHAMQKRPEERYATVLEFARALQKVQIELAMSVTPVDVLDDSADAPDERDDDDGLTRVRSVVSINPERPPVHTVTAVIPPGFPAAVDDEETVRPPIRSIPADLDRTQLRGATAPLTPDAETARAPGFGGQRLPARAPLDETYRRTDPAPASEEAGAGLAGGPRRRRALVPIIAGIVVVLVGAAVIAALTLGAPSGRGSAEPPVETAAPVDAVNEAAVPDPAGLTGVVGASGVVFTWTNPAPETGDSYLWRATAAGQDNPLASVTESTVTIPASAAGPTCIEVSIRRSDGRAAAQPTSACAP